MGRNMSWPEPDPRLKQPEHPAKPDMYGPPSAPRFLGPPIKKPKGPRFIGPPIPRPKGPKNAHY